jgi:hypothetical protein
MLAYFHKWKYGAAGRRTGSGRAAPLALRATTVSGGQPSRARELVSSPLLQFSSLKKPFFESGEDGRKRSYGQHPSKVKRRGLDHARHSRFPVSRVLPCPASSFGSRVKAARSLKLLSSPPIGIVTIGQSDSAKPEPIEGAGLAAAKHSLQRTVLLKSCNRGSGFAAPSSEI